MALGEDDTFVPVLLTVPGTELPAIDPRQYQAVIAHIEYQRDALKLAHTAKTTEYAKATKGRRALSEEASSIYHALRSAETTLIVLKYYRDAVEALP